MGEGGGGIGEIAGDVGAAGDLHERGSEDAAGAGDAGDGVAASAAVELNELPAVMGRTAVGDGVGTGCLAAGASGEKNSGAGSEKRGEGWE